MAAAVRFATIGTNFITDAFLAASKDVPGFELCAPLPHPPLRPT